MYRIQRYATPDEFHRVLLQAAPWLNGCSNDDRLWALCLWYVNQEHPLTMDLALRLKGLYDNTFFHERSALRTLIPSQYHCFCPDTCLDTHDDYLDLPAMMQSDPAEMFTESVHRARQLRTVCHIWRRHPESLGLIAQFKLVDDWMHMVDFVYPGAGPKATKEPPRLNQEPVYAKSVLPNFAAGGHINIFGAARTGKTTLLRYILPKESIQEWDNNAVRQELLNTRADPIWFEIHENQTVNWPIYIEARDQGPFRRIFTVRHEQDVPLSIRGGVDWCIFIDPKFAHTFLIRNGLSEYLDMADTMEAYEFMVYDTKTGQVTFHDAVPFPAGPPKECRAAAFFRQGLLELGHNQETIQALIDYYYGPC